MIFFYAYTSLELSNMRELIGCKQTIDDWLEDLPRVRIPPENEELYEFRENPAAQDDLIV